MLSILLSGRKKIGAKPKLLRLLLGTSGIQAAGMATLFCSHVLLARALTAEDYGRLVFLTSCVVLASIPGKFGVDRALARYVSRAVSLADGVGLKRDLRFIGRLTFATGLFTVLLATIMSIAVGHVTPVSRVMLIAAVLLLLPITIYTYYQKGLMVGMGDVVMSKIPTELLRPLLVICGVLPIYLLEIELPLTGAILLFSFSLMFAAIIGALFIRSRYRKLMPTLNPLSVSETQRVEFQDVTPFVLVSAAQTVARYIDVILIGVFIGPAAVAIYSVGARISSLIVFVQRASSPAIQPLISGAWSGGDSKELKRVVAETGIYTFVATLAVSTLLVLASDSIFQIFGPEYSSAQNILWVLIFFQLINVGCGMGGALLSMTDNQGLASKIHWIVLCFNIFSAVTLINLFGIIGAALSTGLSIALVNILFAYSCVKNLHINPSILSGLRSFFRIGSKN